MIPLEVGGADIRENLWPESWEAGKAEIAMEWPAGKFERFYAELIATLNPEDQWITSSPSASPSSRGA